MSETIATDEGDASQPRASWTPMIGLFLAQVLMSFNVAALPISLGGMVEDFGVPPTVASSTIVVYGLAVAALVMTGAKLGQRIGWALIFRCVLGVFAASSLAMILSRTVTWAIIGQLLAGAAAAIIVPALVALIAENYRGPQQATAVGSLGSARAFSGVSAFLIGGTLGTFVGWRPIFVITLALAIVVFALSFSLRSDRGDRSIRIDLVASVLIGAAVVMLTLGFNNQRLGAGGRRGHRAAVDPRAVTGPGAGGARSRARSAVLPVDPPAHAAGQGPAGGPERAGQRPGALGGVRDVHHRRDGGGGELHGADLHPGGPGTHGAGHRAGDDALQPHRLRDRHADRAVLPAVRAPHDRPVPLRPDHARPDLAGRRGQQQLGVAADRPGPDRLRHRPGRPGHAGFQRPGHRRPEASGRRCRLDPRHHPEPGLGRRDRHDGGGSGPGPRSRHRPGGDRASPAAR